jgi:hypothetical protein
MNGLYYYNFGRVQKQTGSRHDELILAEFVDIVFLLIKRGGRYIFYDRRSLIFVKNAKHEDYRFANFSRK